MILVLDKTIDIYIRKSNLKRDLRDVVNTSPFKYETNKSI